MFDLEKAKADQFVHGLRLNIYLTMNPFRPPTYREVVDRAREHEKAL